MAAACKRICHKYKNTGTAL